MKERQNLAKLGWSIFDRASRGKPARLAPDLGVFVDGLASLDGRVPPVRSRPLVQPFSAEAMKTIALHVSVETRNTLEGDAVLPSAAAAALPSTLSVMTALENRVIALARDDFNVFAELVCTDDESGKPIVQAPVHRKWAQLCEDYDRLLIWSHVEAAKTTQISILRTVWELGRDSKLRFVILSNTSGQATKIVKAIASYIKNHETVHKIFPDLKADPEGSWTTTELQVVRPNNAKDPSVRAVGVRGALTGGRVDRLVIDDILDLENTDSPANRKSLDDWVRATALGRLTKNARVTIVGTAFHPADLLHVLEASGQYHAVRFPILDADDNITWPEAWSRERIEKKRIELGPAEYTRQLLCQARDDSSSRFKQVDIDSAIAKGRGLTLVREIAEMPEGCATFTGVDLAMSKKKKSDDTVLFTFMEDAKGNRTLLNIEIGKFSAPEIVDKIIDHHRRYKSTIAVESNAAQSFILDFTRELSNVPIVPHLTTRQKRDPLLGVESLAIELANGKWIIPSDGRKVAPNVDRWVTEMLFYDPHAHTGDVLMACYFAREVARRTMGSRAVPTVVFRLIGEGASSAPSERPWTERINDVPEVSAEKEANARAALRDALNRY